MIAARIELGMVTIFAFLPALFSGCHDRDCVPVAALFSAPPSTSLESETKASEIPKSRSQRFVGVILSRQSVDLAPRFEGKIGDVLVRLGDRVPEGGLIAVLDTPSVAFDVRMAEAALKSAEFEREQAKKELVEAEERSTRRELLSAEGLATGEDAAAARYQLAIKKARFDALSAQIDERRERLAQLRQTKTDLRILAPFEGYIAARFVDRGASVTSATPVVRLVGTRSLFVRFAVQESDIAALSAGRSLRVVTVDGPAEIVLDGKVDKLSPEIDAASRMVVVEATIDAQGLEEGVLPGQGVEVALPSAP